MLDPPYPPVGSRVQLRGPTILLLDCYPDHANDLESSLRDRKGLTLNCRDPQTALQIIRSSGRTLDLVVLNVSVGDKCWVKVLRTLRKACGRYCDSPRPLFLCFSTVRKDPTFVLSIEQAGARYTYAP